MTMRWIGTGRSARGAPAVRQGFRLRPLTLVVVAVAALTQTGCQSGGFLGGCGASPCGDPCGGSGGPCNYLKSLRERMFSRGIGGGGCCGGSGGATLGAAPIEYGAPAVVTPAPATVVPALPAAPAEPTDLTPAPIEKTPSAAPDPTSSIVPGTKGRTGLGTSSTRGRLGYRDGDSISRTMASTPQPTFGSARGSAAAPDDAVSESWLDNLPPLQVPREEDRNEVPAPAPPAAVAARVPAARVPTATIIPMLGTMPEPPTSPAPAENGEVSVAPGISRFVPLEPKLSGGSLPTTAGLDWLVEKGYKTLLDLRESREAQPEFIDEVVRRGLRYVALPLGLKNVDSVHVARFNAEITEANARPLYFCDTDGTRAGVLWYIRRMTVDKVDPQVARREAEELGLSDKPFWGAATVYLDRLKPAPAEAANAPEPPKPDEPAVPTPAAGSEAMVSPPPAVTDISQIPYESYNIENLNPRDTTGWRSYAALVVTGLGVPLAYWTRSSIPSSLRMLTRASLGAPARQPKSLPAASDE